MVRIHVKHGEGSEQKEFLYDCASTSPIDEIAPEISRISNLQTKIDRLILELEPRLDLLHGDAKAASLLRALSEAKSYASKDQVVYNKPLSYHVLRNHIQALERELKAVSEFQELLGGIEFGGEDSSRLCWAGKVLDGSKRLCDYIGSNEKTKIVIKLQSTDSCPA
ncbi:hypothetical protein ACFX2I_001162 [Malus domestica]|uniref:uncharacterized protein isoform X1 n=1 Tax=Malus domestica TaxID=3750 RepID=UPI0010AB2991|nr:cilia- and flagella-associated protein 298-B-like [Malus domestica]